MVGGRFGLLAALVAVGLFACVGCNRSTATDGKAVAAHDEHDEHGHKGHDHKDPDHKDPDHKDPDHKDHDHKDHAKADADDDHPKTYAEAVKQVEALRDTIRDALKAGETDKADTAVHEIGHTLEHIPALLEATSLPATDVTGIKELVEILMDYFGKIDEELHAGKGTSYDELASKIDLAIQRLRESVKE